nr:hypothetical protein [Tanacetum cinerariifolium]
MPFTYELERHNQIVQQIRFLFGDNLPAQVTEEQVQNAEYSQHLQATENASGAENAVAQQLWLDALRQVGPDIDKVRTPAPPNRQFHGFSSNLYRDGYPNCETVHPTDLQLLSWLENYATTTDSQLDEFNFNFNGYTGKFVMDANNVPVSLPQTDLKIEYTKATSTFKITTPNGTRYYFGGDASDITFSSTGGYTKFLYEGNSSQGDNPPPPKELPPTEVSTIDTNNSLTFFVKEPTAVSIVCDISCNCPQGGCTQLPDDTRAGELVMNGTTVVAAFDFSRYNARGDCARSSGMSLVLQPGYYGLGKIPHSPYNISLKLTSTNTGGLFISPDVVGPTIPLHTDLDGTWYGGVRVKATIDVDPLGKTEKTTYFAYSGMSGSYLPSYEMPVYKFG